MSFERKVIHTIPDLPGKLIPVVDEFTRRYPDPEAIPRIDVLKFSVAIVEALPEVSDKVQDVVEELELDDPLTLFDAIVSSANEVLVDK